MTVSLLENESTGGAIARVGFEYQDAYVLQNLPKWLSQSAFSHVVSEATGDIEVCYFSEAGRVRHVMLEAKNHVLTAPEFWTEIARLKKAYDDAPLDFIRFGLVCSAFNSKTRPFVAMLERLRGVGLAYHPDSVILQTDRDEVIAWASKQDVRANFPDLLDLADFALQRVNFERYSSESSDSAFPGELQRFLPTLDVTGRQAVRLRDLFKAHIASSSFGPVFRKTFEQDLCDVLGAARADWLGTPTPVNLKLEGSDLSQLTIPADEFVGPKRSTKVAADWQKLSETAHAASAFLADSTERQGVVLDGRQGMSAACLLGHAFRATRRFVLQVEHNGSVYRTDVYDQAAGPFFRESIKAAEREGQQGIASIAFTTAVGSDLDLCGNGQLSGLPLLELDSSRAVSSQAEMTLAVAEAKSALVAFRSDNKLVKLHLFIKGPAAFAMLLGHRLNGICQVQLYDWVAGAYRATALLDAA